MTPPDPLAAALEAMLDLQARWQEGSALQAVERRQLLAERHAAEELVDELLTQPEHKGHRLNDLARRLRDRQARTWNGEKGLQRERDQLARELRRCLKGLLSPHLALQETPSPRPCAVVGYGR